MSNPTISIIVPVYKVEQYIRRCIDSILAQTYTDWELLLIDDGSPDQSGAICDEYATIDNRIRVFHKENGGVSSARNLGLDNAKGEWVTFVDSDDELLTNALNIYISHAEEGVDIIKAGYLITDIQKNKREIKQIQSDIILSDKEQVFLILEHSNYCGFLWNSLVRKNVIKDRKFDEQVSWCEDHIFIYELISVSRCITILSQPVYNYFIDSEKLSLSSKAFLPNAIVYAAEKERDVKLRLIGSNPKSYAIVNKSYEEKIVKALINNFIINGLNFHCTTKILKASNNPFCNLKRSIKGYLAYKKKIFSNK